MRVLVTAAMSPLHTNSLDILALLQILRMLARPTKVHYLAGLLEGRQPVRATHQIAEGKLRRQSVLINLALLTVR